MGIRQEYALSLLLGNITLKVLVGTIWQENFTEEIKTITCDMTGENLKDLTINLEYIKNHIQNKGYIS